MSGTTEASAIPSERPSGDLAGQPGTVDGWADQEVEHQPRVAGQLRQLPGQGELLGGVSAIDQRDLARPAVALGGELFGQGADRSDADPAPPGA